MNQILLESLVILVLVLINGVLAMSEIAIVSARRGRLEHLAESGSAGARAALNLAANPNQFLATLQIGITLVGVLAGAFGGATLARGLAPLIGQIEPLAPWQDGLAVGAVVLGITYLSLVLGELVPKRIGLSAAERISAAMARPMQAASRLGSPLVRLLGASTDAVLALFRIRVTERPEVTEDEIRRMVRQGTHAGVLERAEWEMIEGVFRLGDRRVTSVMTPRQQVVWLDVTDPFEVTRATIAAERHSRYPVARGDLDDLLGVLRTRDLFVEHLSRGTANLETLCQPALVIPETTTVLRALERFKQERADSAVVVDEFGSVQGLLTVQDVLEAIVGEVPEAGQTDEPRAVRRADGSWLLDGLLDLGQMKEKLGLAELPDEEAGTYHTVGGFVMHMLGTIPDVSDSFDWQGVRFEVVDMDGRRVDQVLAVRLGSAAANPER